jgi:hypothetical protein
MSIKSYEQFLNENLIGAYSYYGQGSLYPIVKKLSEEGKTPQQVYTYLTTLGIDEERKQRVLGQVFQGINESLFEDDDILNADVNDLTKGISPSKAKPDKEVKAALDKLKKGDDEETADKAEDDETKTDDEAESAKIAALQSALKDAEKLEKIKKILTEGMEMDIDGVEESILIDLLDYHLDEKLDPAVRAKLKDTDFIFQDKRSWPIHDEKHAKTALVWATWPQYKDIKNDIVKAVMKKYPNLKGVGAAK